MKKYLLLAFFGLWICSALAQDDLMKNVEWVVEPSLEYDHVGDFSEGLARTVKNNKQGFIDKTGKIVIPLIYDFVGDFSEGLATVGKNRKYGFIDKTGKIVIPLVYDNPVSFSEGFAEVGKDDKSGFIDKAGKVVIPLVHDYTSSFSEGFAQVWKDNKSGFIDKTGKVVIPLIFESCSNFSEREVFVKYNNKWGIIRNPLLKKKENLTSTLRYYTPRENNYRNQTYILNQSKLPIELEIETTTPVTKANCRTLINGKIAKSGEVDLRKDGNNQQKHNYFYQDAITFSQTGDYTIQVEIIKDNVIIGRSIELKVQYQPEKINLHLLTVGTAPPDLHYTQTDATDVKNLFTNHSLYKNVLVEELLGEDASATNIAIQLANLQQQYPKSITDRDLIILFFSSHGYASEDGKFYIQADDFSRLALQKTAISLDEIFQKLHKIPCKKILLIDACHSGTQDPSQLIAMKDNEATNTARVLKKLLQPQDGWTVITSSGEEPSWEHTNWQNGSFTEALQEALKQGKADTNQNGFISIQELADYLQLRVPKLNQTVGHPKQYPQVFSDLDEDLEIYKY